MTKPWNNEYTEDEFSAHSKNEMRQKVLFDAESETKRYQISIIAKSRDFQIEERNQTSSIAFYTNCALHNIVDGKTYIVRESFDKAAAPISSNLVKILGEDIKSFGSKAILQVCTKFNSKYRIDANLSIRMSEKLVENSEDMASGAITGRSVRKELELACDEKSSGTYDENRQIHVWNIKSKDETNSDGAYLQRNKVSFFCNDDTSITLVVICEIVITNHCSLNGLNLHSLKEGANSKKRLESLLKSCKDVGVLLNDAINKNSSRMLDHLSDIELVAEGKPFKCHKLLLSISSKVFAELFAPEEKSFPSYTDTNIIENYHTLDIKEFDVETVDKMVQFIYKGKLSKEYSYASLRLLALANKYEISGLKLHCEAALIETLDVENVILLWLSAKRNDACYLKGASEEFMYEYWDKGLQNTEEFQKLSPKHAMEILSSILALVKGANEP